MRKYYMNFYRDFGNTYTLLYAEGPEDDEVIATLDDCHQVSRKEAEHMARQAKAQNDEFASHDIIPARLYGQDIPYNHGYDLRGVIWEKI